MLVMVESPPARRKRLILAVQMTPRGGPRGPRFGRVARRRGEVAERVEALHPGVESQPRQGAGHPVAGPFCISGGAEAQRLHMSGLHAPGPLEQVDDDNAVGLVGVGGAIAFNASLFGGRHRDRPPQLVHAAPRPLVDEGGPRRPQTLSNMAQPAA